MCPQRLAQCLATCDGSGNLVWMSAHGLSSCGSFFYFFFPFGLTVRHVGS